jgi:osmotically-inducible protein OsmY
MRPDSDIKRDVEAELHRTPSVDPSDIGVTVKDGVVTLAGFVKSYGEKYGAEAAVKRVDGVAGLANDLQVRLPAEDRRPDPEIARDAVAAIRAQVPSSAESIRVIVRSGWLTLEGEVQSDDERERAERAVRTIRGVVGVGNLIRTTVEAA